MPEKRKPGRPKGAQNKIGRSLKQMLEDMANGMAPVVAAKLERMAGSCDPDVNEFYIKTFLEINKFIVPKPVDITAHVDSDFQSLYERWKAATDPEE